VAYEAEGAGWRLRLNVDFKSSSVIFVRCLAGLSRLLQFGRFHFNRKRNIHVEAKIPSPINPEICLD
jgi:hypothetical protein